MTIIRDVYVDSRRGQSNNVYTLTLHTPLINVKEASILSLTMTPGSASSLQRGDIAFLDIMELRRAFDTDCLSNVIAPQTPASTAFGLIHLKDCIPDANPVKYMVDKKDSYVITYPKAIDRIDRFTIQWLNYDGTGIPMDQEDYNIMMIRVLCDDDH